MKISDCLYREDVKVGTEKVRVLYIKINDELVPCSAPQKLANGLEEVRFQRGYYMSYVQQAHWPIKKLEGGAKK